MQITRKQNFKYASNDSVIYSYCKFCKLETTRKDNFKCAPHDTVIYSH
jgi:hypothetical protein